jgi:hypothetical protein
MAACRQLSAHRPRTVRTGRSMPGWISPRSRPVRPDQPQRSDGPRRCRGGRS